MKTLTPKMLHSGLSGGGIPSITMRHCQANNSETVMIQNTTQTPLCILSTLFLFPIHLANFSLLACLFRNKSEMPCVTTKADLLQYRSHSAVAPWAACVPRFLTTGKH